MTGGRWEKAGKFPPPDLRINGRKYWTEETYARWLADQQDAEAARRDHDTSSAEDTKIADAYLETKDQLGHNGTPSLDDAVPQTDPLINIPGSNIRGGENG